MNSIDINNEKLLTEKIEDSFIETDNELQKESCDAGSTAAIAVIVKNNKGEKKAFVANVGDSRIVIGFAILKLNL